MARAKYKESDRAYIDLRMRSGEVGSLIVLTRAENETNFACYHSSSFTYLVIPPLPLPKMVSALPHSRSIFRISILSLDGDLHV